jgi:hypothetical protein
MIGFMLLCMIPDAVIHAASIRITWNANRESDLSGYKVYYGTAPGTYGSPIDAENVTAYDMTGLTAGTRYFIALTAYDTANNESAQSLEVSGIAETVSTITSTLPPSVTTSITTTSSIPPTTTTIPFTSTQPSSSTTTAGDATASCEQSSRLQPLAVTASTPERLFFPVANIIDGDPQTSWATLFTLFRKDASIILDLGSEKTITSLSLYATRIFGLDFLPVTLELQISNDNATWQTINAAAESIDLETANVDSWQLPGHACRYIKLCMGGPKSLFLLQLAQIAELEIYGCAAEGHPPFAAQGASSSETAGEVTATKTSSRTAVSEEEPVTPGIPGRPIVSFK